ncbi:hypothetical protein ACVB8X_01905 [Streptomyces sp. NRAIS4]
MIGERTADARRAGDKRGQAGMGSGAGVIVFAVLVVWPILMAAFGLFVGSRTSWRMGLLVSVPLILMPYGLWLFGAATQ